MKKTFFLLGIFLLLLVASYFLRFRKDTDLSKNYFPPAATQAPKVKLPSTLTIPSIKVTAAVEYVGMDSKGNMDVPKRTGDVAWYNLGPRPGESGSAVIAGHLDDVTGAPAVFWELKKLKIGDKIYITDADGKNFTFIVTKVTSYDWNKFPLRDVFANYEGKKLNLITCGGIWDKTSKNYSKRTVVYSQIDE